MKEIRLHGRGGQGVVKSSHLIVETVVNDGGFAQFIPFFGVERKGSPVFGYLRIDSRPIRMNTQIYEPGLVMVFDDTLLDHAQTFAGLKDGGIIILNTNRVSLQKDGERILFCISIFLHILIILFA